MLSKWIKKTKRRIDKVFQNVQIYQGLIFKVNVEQNNVSHIRRIKDNVLHLRKDLEKGFLSEHLLPMESLKKLITSSSIPKGVEFIQPLHWHYAGINVKRVNIGSELDYCVNLPLV